VVDLYPSDAALSTSLNPSPYGQSVTFTATITSNAPGVPTGTATFKNGTTVLGTSAFNASGVAALTKNNLAAGANSITVVYNGDSETTKSASTVLVQTVNKAATNTSIASLLNPPKTGQVVTLTAKVTSTTTVPTGSVTFMDSATGLATVNLIARKASYGTSTWGSGPHIITAVYNGTTNIAGSTSPTMVQVVN